MEWADGWGKRDRDKGWNVKTSFLLSVLNIKHRYMVIS